MNNAGSNLNERQNFESKVLNETGNASNTFNNFYEVPRLITVPGMIQILQLLKILLVPQITTVMEMLHHITPTKVSTKRNFLKKTM